MADGFCVISFGKQPRYPLNILPPDIISLIIYTRPAVSPRHQHQHVRFSLQPCVRVILCHYVVAEYKTIIDLQSTIYKDTCLTIYVCLIFFTVQMIIILKIMTMIRWKKNNVTIGEVPNMFLMTRKLPLTLRNFLNINYYFA